jgi:hypothetical protein
VSKQEFCERAWKIIAILQQFKADDVELYLQQLNQLYNILTTIPGKQDNISFADLSNYFDFIDVNAKRW